MLFLVKSDLIDEKSFKFNFNELPSSSSSMTNDKLILTAADGEKTSLSFPGCYRITLSFRLKRPIKNPYIETFMRMGTNLPCQSEEHSSSTVDESPHSTCTNISRPVDWCPQTQNKQMRQMLRDKNTWFVYNFFYGDFCEKRVKWKLYKIF